MSRAASKPTKRPENRLGPLAIIGVLFFLFMLVNVQRFAMGWWAVFLLLGVPAILVYTDTLLWNRQNTKYLAEREAQRKRDTP